ncbi:MAG: hypothetical protein HYT73_04890 [Candidatus Aenigmarchaeota archaeon]|nr:hypothetical protein [Candidatus Aenigmarchaeota archaeon]
MEEVSSGTKKNGRKGQMFLIAMVFILIGFFTVRSIIDIYDVFEEKRTQDIKIEDLQLRNIMKEYGYAAGIATMQPDANRSAQDYLFNLSSFIRNTRDARILYAIAYANGSTGKYSVTVGNFLDENINGTVSGTNSVPASQQFIITDRKNVTYEFNFTANGTVELNITYTTGSIDTKELLNVTVQDPGLFIEILSDVTLGGSDIKLRSKEIYNRTWRVP